MKKSPRKILVAFVYVPIIKRKNKKTIPFNFNLIIGVHSSVLVRT